MPGGRQSATVSNTAYSILQLSRNTLPVIPVGLKRAVGHFIFRHLPGKYNPTRYLHDAIWEKYQGMVPNGPFKGMSYVRTDAGYHMGPGTVPKWLGIYELELWPIIERIVAGDYRNVVDIGAGEGYYVVGLARRLPKARVVAYEAEDAAQAALSKLVAHNGVADRVTIRGQCSASSPELNRDLTNDGGTIVLCDVEGYERELLDPNLIPALKRSAVLVELHNFIHRDIDDVLRLRFEATHKIERIWQESRDNSLFPCQSRYISALPPSYVHDLLDERRPERMSWLWMTPLTSSHIPI